MATPEPAPAPADARLAAIAESVEGVRQAIAASTAGLEARLGTIDQHLVWQNGALQQHSDELATISDTVRRLGQQLTELLRLVQDPAGR